MWWGLYAMAASTPSGWLTVLSPTLMTWLLMRVSGVTLLEDGLKARSLATARTSPARRRSSHGFRACRGEPVRHTQLVNYTLYQIGWFACVLGAASQRPWTGCLMAMILVGVHLALSWNALEVRLVVLATAVGAAVEMMQIAAGTYRFTSGR